MNRANTVYLMMTGVFCVGVWAILSMGTTYLVAPTDLSGTWHCVPEEANPPSGKSILIHQSGKYFEVIVDDHKPLSLVLSRNQHSEPTDSEMLTLNGNGWEIIAIYSKANNSAVFTFKPPGGVSGPVGHFTYQRGAFAMAVDAIGGGHNPPFN